MSRRRGSITGNKTDGYQFCVDVGRVNGKRRRTRHRGFRTRAEAQIALNEVLGHQSDGTFIQPHKDRLGVYLEEWLEAIEKTVAPSTHSSYRQKVRLHVIPHLGDMRLADLDGMSFNRLYGGLLSDGRRDGTGGLAPRTVRYIHTILHRALKDAVRWGRLYRNPVDLADPPRQASLRDSDPSTWSAGEVLEFLEHCSAEGDRYLPLWGLLATTGMRRGESLGLRWSDLDLHAGVASIVQTVIAVDHRVEFSKPKTASGNRSINLDAETVRLLRRQKLGQTEERLLVGSGWANHDLVFTKPDGTPLHPERVSREFQRRIERINRDRQDDDKLTRIRLHDLRHTWATLAMQSGIPPKVVQERLGHSRISITLDIYSHVSPGMQQEAADLIASQIYAVGHHLGTNSAPQSL